MRRHLAICLGIWCLASLSCGGGLALSPPPPLTDQPLAPNPTDAFSGQWVALQGSSDLSVESPIHFHVPLPAPALGARLYLYGQMFSPLHYSEIGSHTHVGVEGHTAEVMQSHSHRLFVGMSSPAGTTSVVGGGLCTGYQSLSAGNPACDGERLIELTRQTHDHRFTPEVSPFGVMPVDENNRPIAVSTVQKTFCDHVSVTLDGEDLTPRLGSAAIGDGSAQHVLNSTGLEADVGDLLSEAGHHRFSFQMNDATSLTSRGGRLHYVLWVKLSPPTP